MKRRNKRAKTRRRNRLTPKRRGASKAPQRDNFSPPREGKNVARLSRELNEAFEQQAATADILNIISNSPPDTQPVFEAIVQSVLKLFPDALISLALRYGDRIDAAAVADRNPERAEAWRRTFFLRTPLSREYMHGVAMLDCRIVDVPDASSAPAEFAAGARNFLTSGNRAITITPLVRRNEAIGLLSVVRRTAGPLSDKQLSLLRTFAAQAVIAIENTRLLNELRQSLEQQTATSEVLKVIAGSSGELTPVFEAMLENAVRICDAKFGTMWLREGDAFRAVAVHNAPSVYETMRRNRIFHPVDLHPKSAFRRLLETRQVIHIADLRMDQGYLDGAPTTIELVDTVGARAVLLVPMLKDNELVGSINMYRQEVRLFNDKQIELLTNFAAQAVIAIENARLLNELRQSLEQQTATSEVLRVISSSATDLRPVFETIVHNSVHLCGATYGVVFRFDGETISFGAHHKLDPAGIDALNQMFPMRPNAKAFIGRAILERNVVHIADVAAEPDNPYAATQQALGIRTFLGVPMLRDGNPIGAIALFRREVGLFSDRQIELVKAFADQAVIAIENARLLNDLNTLNQQLEQRVTDQVSEIERIGRLRRFLPPQVADLIVASGTEKQLESHRREITALFCDLRGFTGFSESSDPEDVMALLRDYHAAIGQIIIKYSGTLERYAGDGVMVVFNDPVPLENPALQAVLMALEMRDAIGALTETWHRWGHDIGFGIGIAHGFATLGTIGFEGRFDYAAIGTVSNVASRLCDEAKPGQILISPRVLTKVENAVTVEPVGEFTLKGIRRPMMAYNVVASHPN